jgi:hypothetical protein
VLTLLARLRVALMSGIILVNDEPVASVANIRRAEFIRAERRPDAVCREDFVVISLRRVGGGCVIVKRLASRNGRAD